MSYQVVLFDVDNTLVDRTKVFIEMLREQIGPVFADQPGRFENEVLPNIRKWDNNGMVDRLKVFEKYVEEYPEETRTAKEINDYWKDHSGEIVYVFDDAQVTMDYLASKYRLGILSNGNVISQRRKIANLPFVDMMEYSLVSEEYICNKPDPRIFQKVCDDLGVSSRDVVYVGDNPVCDIQGALGANMDAIWVNKKGEKYPDERVVTIRNLKELKDLL